MVKLDKLSEHNRRFGPVTVGWDPNDRKSPFFLWCYLETVTAEESIQDLSKVNPHVNTLTIHCNKVGSIRFVLPNIIKPLTKKVKATYWSEETIKKLDRDWYYEYKGNRYGFTLTGTGGSLYYGIDRKTATRRYKGFEYPWCLSYIGTVTHNPEDNTSSKLRRDSLSSRDINYAHYLIKDYDGELVVASIHSETLHYRRGRVFLKWVGKLLPKSKHHRLNINFSKETGSDKVNSWKGGTLGVSFSVDSHLQLSNPFTEYLNKHGMEYIGFMGYGKGAPSKEYIYKTVEKNFPIYLNSLISQNEEVK